MENEKFISIVIPVYNPGIYLNRCICSVLRQDSDDYEIVLVDDGSTDGSSEKCEELAKKYKNIKCIHQENLGQIKARENGVANSVGSFIMFLDSDDELIDGALIEIINLLKKDKQIDILCYNWDRIDENQRIIKVNKPPLFRDGLIDKDEFFSKLISCDELNSVCFKICKKKLFKNTAFSDRGVVYNGEDLLQTIRLFDESEVIYYTSSKFYLYRINTHSVSNVYRENRYKSLDIVRPYLFDYMMEKGYGTEENIDKFYDFYLFVLAKEIIAYLMLAEGSKEEMKEVFDEIIHYNHVQLLREKMNKYNHFTKEFFAVRMFFWKRWGLLRALIWLRQALKFKSIKRLIELSIKRSDKKSI